MLKRSNLIRGIILFFLSIFVLFFKPGWHDMANVMKVFFIIILLGSIVLVALYYRQKKKARQLVEYKKIDDNTGLVTVTSGDKIYEVELHGFTDENIEAIRKLKEELKEKESKNPPE